MAPIEVESLAWSRVSHDDTVFNPTPGVDMMWSVTRGGPGFVAVGRTFSSDAPAPIPVEMDWAYWQNLGSYILGDGDLRYRGEPAVWVSEDGITWSRLSDDALPEFDRSGVIESVTAGGPGLVAVGADISPPLHPVGPPELPVSLSVQRALGEWAWNGAVWTSEDGLVWSNVELPEPDNHLVWFNDVTAGGPGLVAVGSGSVPEGQPVEVVTHARTAAVWTSPDGETWTRVPHDPDVFGSGVHDRSGDGLVGDWSMEAVTVGGPGLIAVGHDPDGPAVWTSPDGFAWTLVPPTQVQGDGTMLDVVANGPGLVAVGSNDKWGEGPPQIWTSPDGHTWTLVPDRGFPAPTAGWPLRSVISVDSQLVAVGGYVWTSVDGVTWTQPEISGYGVMYSVARTEDGLIAVGLYGGPDSGPAGGAAAVWATTQG